MEIQQIAYKNEERNYNIKFNFAGEEHEMNIGLDEILEELEKIEN